MSSIFQRSKEAYARSANKHPKTTLFASSMIVGSMIVAAVELHPLYGPMSDIARHAASWLVDHAGVALPDIHITDGGGFDPTAPPVEQLNPALIEKSAAYRHIVPELS